MGGGGRATSGTNQQGVIADYPWLREQRSLRQRRAQEFEDEAGGRVGRGTRFIEESTRGSGFGDRTRESSYGRGRELYGGLTEGGVAGRSYGRGRETSQRLADDVGFSGAGREGYADFATTGGFGPGSEQLFIRSATSPLSSIYGHARNEISRRRTVQGGYSPGYDTSTARLTRQAASDVAEGTLGARAEFERQQREGKLQGLGGLERIRIAISCSSNWPD